LQSTRKKKPNKQFVRAIRRFLFLLSVHQQSKYNSRGSECGMTTRAKIFDARDVLICRFSIWIGATKNMFSTRVAIKASLPTLLAAAVSAAVVFTSGCSMTNLTSADITPMSGAAIKGKVHGGQFPVSGSAIGLWVAGSTGYGSLGHAGASLLTTPVSTGADGSFAITGDYTCPTASSLVYITATGGNPGIGSNNSSIALMAPLGPCSALSSSTFITINEVTTAAAAIALGQFFTPTFGGSSTDGFGASATNSTGLTNAFSTVNSLVNTASGTAVTSATLTTGSLTLTATPESAKLNTIANVIAACVNSDGGATSPCQTTLFPDVTPAGGTAPTDTLQAAVYMSLNPTSNNSAGSLANLTALYGLQTATAPFVGLGTQPADWTVGIQYTDASATILSQPQNIAADVSGNIWVVNTTGGGLVELSPTGTPLVNALTSNTAGSGINGASPRNLAIDTNNNIWITTSTSKAYIYEYVPTSGAFSTFTTSKSSYGLAIDGNNNVFVGSASGSSVFELYEFPGGNIANVVQYPIAGPTPGTPGASGTNTWVLPQYMAFDTFGNLWMTNGSASSTTSNETVQLSNINISACTTYPCSVTTSTAQNTYTAINQGTMSAPWGVAATTNGLWVSNAGASANSLTNLSLSGSTVNSGTNYGSITSLTSPHYNAVDGAGNLWSANKNASPGTVSEFSSTGTILSPVAVSPATTPTGFVHTGLASGQGITIDASGNVWVADNVASGGTMANTVFEIVGSAAPTVTPLATALNLNKVGQKP
jgi:hypothetical protein